MDALTISKDVFVLGAVGVAELLGRGDEAVSPLLFYWGVDVLSKLLLGLWSVRFGTVFAKTETVPNWSVSVLLITETDQFR